MKKEKPMDKWSALQGFLRCPLCRGGLRQSAASLRCPKGHTFDVSGKGYVNFIPGQRPLKGYDAVFFAARRQALQQGYYRHVLAGLQDHIRGLKTSGLLLDAGCGEGYYAQALQDQVDAPVLALDVSKEAVRRAAAPASPVGWMVADIANMPVQNGKVSCLLNIFTPANYGEFARVLERSGTLLKVVPGEEHFIQLRKAAGTHLRGEEYNSQRVKDYFSRRVIAGPPVRLHFTYPLPPEHRLDLLRMSPVAFGVGEEELLGLQLEEITVDAWLLSGQMKRRK